MAQKSKNTYQPKVHLLAFVDTLGFYKEIQNKKSQKIKEYLKVFGQLKKNWKFRNSKEELKLTAIGDSVIIGVDVSRNLKNGKVLPSNLKAYNESLYNLFWAVAELQYGLALKDIWTRGAITLGLVDFDPEHGRLLGPAFHTVYKLESTVAKYPRVIIDGVVIRAAGLNTSHEFINAVHSVYQQASPTPVLYNYYSQQGPTTFDQDVPTFIDFAGWGVNRIGNSPLKIFSEHVSARLKEDVEHFDKYRWLADYLINVIVSAPDSKSGINLDVLLERLQQG